MSSVAARTRAANHMTQATHNKKLADEPLFPPTDPNSPYRDWVITISFYAALHYFTSYCNKTPGLPKKFKSHKKRNDWIKKTTDVKIRSMRSDYLALHKVCEDARYTPLYYNSISPTDLRKYYKWAFHDIPTKLGI